MSRPIKTNADYFTHDNDMRNDEKVRAVRVRYKHEGYSVWNMLLEKLCKSNGFVLTYSDLNIELWAGDFDVKPELLKEIIDYFIKIDLLLYHDGLIFSQTMIERFGGLIDKRKRKRESFGHPKPTTNGVSDVQNTQSKLEESKVNKSKEEESKLEIIEISSPKFLIGEEHSNDLKEYLEKNFQILMNDQKIKYGQLIFDDALKEFQERNLQKQWKDNQDLRQHFTNYLRVFSESKNNGKKNGANNGTKDLQSAINIGPRRKMGKL